MTLADELQAIKPLACPSPLRGFEHVRGYGVFALPFDSGHVLALRVFPQNDFAPYRTIWHRTPNGDWSMFVDAPRHDIACPRYYSAAVSQITSSHVALGWTGPTELRIEMDSPRLVWTISVTTTPILGLMNVINPRLPERWRRARVMLSAMEWIADWPLGLGQVTLAVTAPNGQFSMLMPQRMFYITSAHAQLEGEDLGQPTRGGENPSIGDVRLPARPVFAVGRAYFQMRDPVEYRRTIQELREDSQSSVNVKE